MTAPHDTDDVTCPRCGTSLKGGFQAGAVDMEAAVAALEAGETVRVPIECPECDAPLELVETLPKGKATVDVWIEDRREDGGG